MQAITGTAGGEGGLFARLDFRPRHRTSESSASTKVSDYARTHDDVIYHRVDNLALLAIDSGFTEKQWFPPRDDDCHSEEVPGEIAGRPMRFLP